VQPSPNIVQNQYPHSIKEVLGKERTSCGKALLLSCKVNVSFLDKKLYNKI
jgi:hypothetical protein